MIANNIGTLFGSLIFITYLLGFMIHHIIPHISSFSKAPTLRGKIKQCLPQGQQYISDRVKKGSLCKKVHMHTFFTIRVEITAPLYINIVLFSG